MALAVGDILQITDVQTLFGQTCLNVYFFELTELGSAVGYEDIATAFNSHIIQSAEVIQHDGLVHIGINIKNLSNGLDIYDLAINQPGNVAANGSTSYEALAFRLVRSTAATRHGAKRIGGIPDDAVINNNLAAAYTTNVNTLATRMGQPLEVDAGGDEDFIAIPVIVGRFPQGDPNAGELDLSVINPVSMGTFIRPSSQNSRKPGRGI